MFKRFFGTRKEDFNFRENDDLEQTLFKILNSRYVRSIVPRNEKIVLDSSGDNKEWYVYEYDSLLYRNNGHGGIYLSLCKLKYDGPFSPVKIIEKELVWMRGIIMVPELSIVDYAPLLDYIPSNVSPQTIKDNLKRGIDSFLEQERVKKLEQERALELQKKLRKEQRGILSFIVGNYNGRLSVPDEEGKISHPEEE